MVPPVAGATKQAINDEGHRYWRERGWVGDYTPETGRFDAVRPLPMGVLIGANVARLRAERNLTQHELIQIWKRHGLHWPRPKLSALEAGRRDQITVGELVLMALAFGVALEAFVRLPKGWEPPDSVCTVLSPTESEIPIETLRQLLAGEDIEAYTMTVDQEEYGTDSEQRETHTQLPNNVPAQADVELAVRLGVGVVDVLEAAWAEFDMLTMTQERDRRVDELGDLSPGERTAHRGHITRLLSQRIQDRLKGRGLLIPEKEGVDDV